MSTTLTTFPLTADKISDLPAVTSLLTTDKILVNAGASPATSSITKANFISDLDFQPHTDALDSLSNLPPTDEALFLINTLITPEVSSYLRISSGTGQTLGRTPTQVLSDIAAQPRSSVLDVYATVTPTLPGKNIIRLAAPATSGYVQVNSGIDSDAFIRTPAQVRSDIGAFAAASLDNDATLGGSLSNPSKAPSQQAVKKYVDSKVGTTLDPTLNDDTIASAATLALDATVGSQIRVTGAIPVTAITLTEKNTRTLVFDGAVTLTSSATLVLPGGSTTLTTAAGGYANVVGGAGGVVSITQYFPPAFSIHYGGNFYTGGDFICGGPVTIGTGGMTIFPAFSVLSPSKLNTLTINTGAVTNLTAPNGTHTIAAEVGNYSATAQTPAATTRTYITGSAISVPSAGLNVGSKLSWKFNMTKTAAGTAVSTFDICVGTAGTTADTARLSFTKPGGSAAVDEGFVIIEAVVKGPISATGVIAAEFVMYHNLASTGHMIIPVSCSHVDSSAFDLTTANLIIGICITTGSSDAITINQVSAQAFNL